MSKIPRPASKKVLLIGWDAADWNVIEPLMAAGKMPNLERMVNEGVMGNLSTLNPPLSPMLWTSIATGKRPHKHGIYGFSEPTPDGSAIQPITNRSRRTRALWNMFTLADMKSNVVGWWPSHPAEPIKGVMISDMFQKQLGKLNRDEGADAPARRITGDEVVQKMKQNWPMRPGTVHPSSLADKAATYRMHTQEISEEIIQLFVPKFGEVNQDEDHRLESIAKVMSECCSVHNAATASMQLEEWDFMAVYYDAIDHFCHGFMKYHPPRLPWVSEEDFDLYSGVVEAGYRFHDMMLGSLLQSAGEDTTVMLVSDHGFHPDHNRPMHLPNEPAGPAEEHSPFGIFVMKGPGVKRDERIYGASLLDVTPTILHSFGLPVGEDMDGKVLINAFTEVTKPKTVASWDDFKGEDGSHPANLQMDPIEAREAIDQLVELGYIERPDSNMEVAVAKTVRELEYNLARSYMDCGLFGEAMESLRKLLEKYPCEFRFGIQLIRCYEQLELFDEAESLLAELETRKDQDAETAREELKTWLEEKKKAAPEEDDDQALLKHLSKNEQHELKNLRARAGKSPYAFLVLQANLCAAQNKFEQAKEAYEQAFKKGAQPGILCAYANTLLQLNEIAPARKGFEQALMRDPNSVEALQGIARAAIRAEEWDTAINRALDSLNLRFYNPRVHYILARALLGNNQVPRAIESLKVACSQAPHYVEALSLLIQIYEGEAFENEIEATALKAQVQEAEHRLEQVRSGELDAAAVDRSNISRTSEMNVLAMSPNEIARQSKPPEKTIVIVTGLPRSGTSMMMQMLEAGGTPVLSDGTRKADTDNPRGYYEYTPATRLQQDHAWVSDAKGKSVKIVAQLLWHLPRGPEYNYRVIFMERDMDELMSSQAIMLKNLKFDESRRKADSLQNTFKKQLNQIHRFLGAMRVPTLTVKHRDCIDHPQSVAEAVNLFLDESCNVEAMATAVDPALYRNRTT